MNNQSFTQALKGKRTVFIIGTLTFFYPLVLEGKGLIAADGSPARPLKDEEVLEALYKLPLKELMGRGEKPAMLTYKYIEIMKTPKSSGIPPFKH
jgi:hypothetical protein